MPVSSLPEDAKRIAKLLRGRNVSSFVREWGMPGGTAMVQQHKTGKRPISLDAAIVYARAFNRSIYEISPSLAEKFRDVSIFPGEKSEEHLPRFVPIAYGRFVVKKGEDGFIFEALSPPSNAVYFDSLRMQEMGVRLDRLYAIRVDDMEMAATLPFGSTVVVNTGDTHRCDGGLFALNSDGFVVLRRLLKLNGTYHLCAEASSGGHRQVSSFDRKRHRVIGRIIHVSSPVP